MELLKGGTLYPFSEGADPCRKCGALRWKDYSSIENNVVKTVKQAAGPERVYEPAVSRRFWRKATSERFRLTCQFCSAVYYERTKT